MSIYKMRYFQGVRGRIEHIRFMFAAVGQTLEEELIAEGQWPAIKEEQPFGQIPVFYEDDKELSQTQAFARYFARKNGFAGESEWESALCDMYIDGYHDCFNAIIPLEMAIFSGDQEKVKLEYQEYKKTHIKPFMDRYEGFLKKNGGNYFVGKKISWVDLAVAEYLERMGYLFDKDIFTGYPLLQALKERVYAMDGVKEFVAKRPTDIII